MKLEVIEESYLLEIRRLVKDKARLTARVIELEEQLKGVTDNVSKDRDSAEK